MARCRRVAALLTVATAIALACGTGWSTALARLDLPQLARQADRVFCGEVVAVRAAWNDDYSGIVTYASLRPTQHLKGSPPSGLITVERTGGRIGDAAQIVDGAPQFATGETALMFVRATGRGTYTTVGMMQGKFSVARGVVMRTGRMLDDVTATVSALVARQAGATPSDAEDATGLDPRTLYAGDLDYEPTVEPTYVSAEKWNYTAPIQYYVNISGCAASNALAAVQAGYSEWNSVSRSKFKFQYAGTTSASGLQYDSQNVVSWTAIPPEWSGALAVASRWMQGGYIIHCDTIFDISRSWATDGSPSGFDVRSLAAHESGHWLALLDLSNGADIWKTMYYSAAAGETRKRTLHRDDMDGAAYLYPAAIAVSCTSPTPAAVEIGATAPIQISVTNTGGYPLYNLWLDLSIWSPANQKVECTKTPVADAEIGYIGRIDFGSAQGLTLTPGSSRTFTAATYAFSASVTGHTYQPGSYTYKFAAWADGYPGLESEDGVQIPTMVGTVHSAPLTVSGSARLAGQVRKRATGAVLAGATVAAYEGGAPKGTTTANAQGIYQITGLAAGTYTVVASKSGYARQTKPGIAATSGSTTYVNFSLAVSGKLKGQVKNKTTGAPIIGATVIARLGGVIRASAVTTAPWGIYEIASDLPAGSYVVGSSKTGYLGQTRKDIPVTAGATTYVNFNLAPGG